MKIETPKRTIEIDFNTIAHFLQQVNSTRMEIVLFHQEKNETAQAWLYLSKFSVVSKSENGCY